MFFVRVLTLRGRASLFAANYTNYANDFEKLDTVASLQESTLFRLLKNRAGLRGLTDL